MAAFFCFHFKPMTLFEVKEMLNLKKSKMKRLSIVLILLICATGVAQDRQDEKRQHRKEIKKERLDLSPEQIAELKSKKLTLALDLNEAQQKDVERISLEQAQQRSEKRQNKETEKNLSEEDRFKARIARLDSKIAHKKQMKSILTPDQYEKWEKMHSHKKKGKREHRKKRGSRAEKR